MRRIVTLAAVAGALMAGTALAQPMEIRISTPAVPGDWHAEMLYIFEQYVERSAPGEFDVQVYLSSTLFQQGTEPVAMQRGNLEMAMISAQDISNQIPAFSIFTAGYLIRDPAHQQAVFNGPIGAEMYQLVSDEMDIHILGVGYLGTRQLALRGDAEIHTPADLAGVTLRMPGSDTWQFLGAALGANPTPLAFGELYVALQTGAVDGQDNPLPTTRNAGFWEVSDQIVLTGHLVDGVFLSISNIAWNQLDETQQQIFHEAAQAAIAFNNNNRVRQEQALVAFFEENGLRVTTPDVDAFRSRVQDAYLSSPYSANWPDGLLDRINAATP